jgi:hypothetical protein
MDECHNGDLPAKVALETGSKRTVREAAVRVVSVAKPLAFKPNDAARKTAW